MARIPYFFDPATATDEMKERFGKMQPLNVMWMMGHAGPILDGFVAMGRSVLQSSLDPKLRQIAIIRVGVLAGAAYEIHQHVNLGRKVGLAEEKIAALRQPVVAPDLFSPLERAVIAAAEELAKQPRLSDAVFAELSKEFDYRKLQELVLTIGYYTMVSRFLETFGVDIEEPGRVINLPARQA
jgi:4-carboxymuconolactone decarboxylase